MQNSTKHTHSTAAATKLRGGAGKGKGKGKGKGLDASEDCAPNSQEQSFEKSKVAAHDPAISRVFTSSANETLHGET